MAASPRRVVMRWTAAACGAFLTVLGAAVPAAYAGQATNVWLGNNLGTPTGVNNNWFIAPGGQLQVSFGVDGAAAMTDNIVLDVSGTSGHLILVDEDEPDCTVTGKIGSCHPPSWSGTDGWSATLVVRADPGTPLNELGSIVVRDQAGISSSHVTLWGQRPEGSADLQIDTTSPSGRIGDTVPVQVTLRNLGPNPASYWGIGSIGSPAIATYVGISGCTAVTLDGGSFPCGRNQPQAVGTAVTFTLTFRIVKGPVNPSDNSGGLSLVTGSPDPDPGNSTGFFVLKVTGAGGATGDGQAPVTDGRHGGPGAVQPVSAPPSLVPTDGSTAGPSGEPRSATAIPGRSAAAIAVRPAASSTTSAVWVVGVLILIALAGGGYGLTVVKRRRVGLKPTSHGNWE